MNYSLHWSSAEDVVVGFQGLVEQILNQLLSEESRSIPISTVGPAGSAKMVLARKVFEDHRIHAAFNFTFWVRVSRQFNPEDPLWSIGLQLLGQTILFSLKEVDLGWRERLTRLFKDHKNLIVLDDVWRTQDWGCILNELPTRSWGSWIIVTSCNREVASSCVHGPGYLHELNVLLWKDAQNLFCKNTFRQNGGECLDQLLEWAENIVKKCEGMPFALQTIGSPLSDKSPTLIKWKKIHDTIRTDLSIIRSLLPSYNDLQTRSDLKSCFFYLGIIPEDYTIR